MSSSRSTCCWRWLLTRQSLAPLPSCLPVADKKRGGVRLSTWCPPVAVDKPRLEAGKMPQRARQAVVRTVQRPCAVFIDSENMMGRLDPQRYGSSVDDLVRAVRQYGEGVGAVSFLQAYEGASRPCASSPTPPPSVPPGSSLLG